VRSGASASGILGVYPPPYGEGRRAQASLRSLRKLGGAAPGWGWRRDAPVSHHTATPNPSPQGGRKPTAWAARTSFKHKRTR
jgi:hypothetical protein